MALNPKLEFFRFALKPKDKSFKTFKEFAITKFELDKNSSDAEIMKKYFSYFIESLDGDYSKDENQKKQITLIKNRDVNWYLDYQPTYKSESNVIHGVINGGSYGRERILSNVDDVNESSKMKLSDSVLQYFYFLLYLPTDHDEGCFILHSNSGSESITKIFRRFISKIFDQEGFYKVEAEFNCFIQEHLTFNKKTNFKKKNGSKNEQYYKWQFLYAIIQSGLFTKDYIGTEVQFPKGNKSSAPLKLDGAIFDDITWFEKYKDYHENGNNESLEWLREHLIVSLEFKKEDNKNIADVWDKQLKAYLNESRRPFCLAVLYDTERLYLFRKYNNKFLRYSEEFNTKGEDSKTKEMALHLPDPYMNIPSFEDLLEWTEAKTIDRSKRGIKELDVISGVHSTQINDAMSRILRTMDKVGMVNQKGFEILIQILSLKIYDEKRNEKTASRFLDFYITEEERNFKSFCSLAFFMSFSNCRYFDKIRL